METWSASHPANPWSGQRRDVVSTLRSWRSNGHNAVLATVISTDSSAPRGVGAQLAIRDDGHWTGGLSGGCAEVAILHAASDLLHGDVADAMLVELTRDELTAAGPACGATLTVLVELVDDTLASVLASIEETCREGTVTEARGTWAILSDSDTGATGIPLPMQRRSREVGPAADMQGDLRASIADGVFTVTEQVQPAVQLVICGGGDIAIELIHLARRLGWRTMLLDSRRSWIDATTDAIKPDRVRHGQPARLLQEVIDPTTACVSCAHDDKLDVPFIVSGLRLGAWYVGSVGSRATQHDRAKQLRDLLPSDLVEQHRGPAGLPIADNSAAGIALSIIAELCQLQRS